MRIPIIGNIPFLPTTGCVARLFWASEQNDNFVNFVSSFFSTPRARSGWRLLTKKSNVDMLLQKGGRMLTMSSRDFNQKSSTAKRVALEGPVFITDRGQISHVLLSYEAYKALNQTKSITDLLACPESADFEFEPEKLSSLAKLADFS